MKGLFGGRGKAARGREASSTREGKRIVPPRITLAAYCLMPSGTQKWERGNFQGEGLYLQIKKKI